MLSALLHALIALTILGQSAGGYSVDPSLPPPETVVHGERISPVETQDRLFSSTRFWRLDPGRYEVEVWWTQNQYRAGTDDSLLQLEIEIGLAPHLQLDLYENFTPTPRFDVEGSQIELRYAFGNGYGAIPLNPVLYLEWHPRHQAPDRGEVRLLLGGRLADRLVWASNLYAESNLDGLGGGGGADAEAGATVAASAAVLGDWLRLGAEAQGGVDQHGTGTFWPSALVGPDLLLAWRGRGLKLTVTAFFGLFARDPSFRLLAIAGWQFPC
jgi:hypothetical protein